MNGQQMNPALLKLEEEREELRSAGFRREIVLRAEPEWVGVRITTQTVGPPQTLALILTPLQAAEIEDFLQTQRLARQWAADHQE